MPRAKGVYRSEWRNCAICGFLYPITMMRRQLGSIRCTVLCTDDLSIMYRPLQIQSVLAQPGEGTSEAAEQFKDPGEYVEF